MRLSESSETAHPLCGLEGRLGRILGRHPLGESPLRVCRRVANSDPFDPDRLQANAIPREKEGILNRRSELDTRHATSLTRVQGA